MYIEDTKEEDSKSEEGKHFSFEEPIIEKTELTFEKEEESLLNALSFTRKSTENTKKNKSRSLSKEMPTQAAQNQNTINY